MAEPAINTQNKGHMSQYWHKALSLPVLLALSACDPTALHTETAPTTAIVEEMPEIAGPDHLGRSFSLAEARTKGPVVVVFYRGHW